MSKLSKLISVKDWTTPLVIQNVVWRSCFIYVEAIAKSQTYFLQSLKAFEVNIKQRLYPFIIQCCDIFSVKQEIQQINADRDLNLFSRIWLHAEMCQYDKRLEERALTVRENISLHFSSRMFSLPDMHVNSMIYTDIHSLISLGSERLLMFY